MRITQKEFDKLSQLDRIEYRQIRTDIDERTSLSGCFDFGLLLSILVIVSTIFIYQITGKMPLQINLALLVIVAYYLICILIYIMMAILHSNLMDKLNNKYFKVNKK